MRKLRLKTMTILLGFALNCGPSLAFGQSTPNTLFHWISDRGLNRWNETIQQEQGFVLKPLMQSIFTTAYPAFQGKDGIFVWSDVAGGMGAFSSGADEWYAMTDKRTGEPARLIAFFLKPGVQVVTLNTYLDRSSDMPTITQVDPKANSQETLQAGLVLHRILDSKTKQIFLQEYVSLKRGALSGIAADPTITRPYLEEALRKLKSPTALPENALHSVAENATAGLNSPRIRASAIRQLEKSQDISGSQIPQFFRMNGDVPAQTEPISCPLLFR